VAARARVTSTRTVANSADVAQAIAGSSIIAEASKYVGVAYRAGGSSPDTGFDCSGFVSYVYSQFGISLPHSSGAYYSVGTRVDSPEPGDIILTPGHVGLYAGPNLQIDAPVAGKSIEFRAIWQHNPIYIRVTG
jgi:cell wall-associated NlpC family hydrolase